MFCVECGKETTIYKQGVCLSCYIASRSFSSGPQVADIWMCSRCNAIKHKNTWVLKPFDDVVQRIIRDLFTISKELENVSLTLDCNPGDKTIPCIVHVKAKLHGELIHEKHPLTLRVKKTICDVCAKQTGGYYEATLQVRADNRQLTENERNQVLQEIDEMVHSAQQKGNTALFITDVTQEHGGLDFYMSEKGAAFTFAKRLLEKHGGELKQSSTNVGMKDSKQVYRMTYLVRFPSYQPQDVIRYQQRHYLVLSMTNQKVHLVQLKNGKTITLEGKEFHPVHVLGQVRQFITDMIVVSQTHEELQVMHPETYALTTIKKSHPVKIKEETVPVLYVEDHRFLMPEINQ